MRSSRNLALLLLLLPILLTASPVLAEDTAVTPPAPIVAPVVETPAAETPAAESLTPALAVPEAISTAKKLIDIHDVALWELLAAVVVIIWGFVKARLAVKNASLAKALKFLEAGVQQVYEDFVREAKAKSPNGKLSSKQLTEARTRALDLATEYAKKEGFNLLKAVAVEEIPVLISRIVSKSKAGESVAP